MRINAELAGAREGNRPAQAAARARGRDRYERFIETLGRRLASGRSFSRELAVELEAASRDEAQGARAADLRTSGAADAPADDPAFAPPKG